MLPEALESPFFFVKMTVSFRGGCAVTQHNYQLIRRIKHIRLRDSVWKETPGSAWQQ